MISSFRFLVMIALAVASCSRASDKLHVAAASPPDAASGDAVPGGSARPRAVQLALGFKHSCALLSDGAVRCWGLGDDGRLGTANTSTIGDDEPPSSAPAVELGGKAVAITAGDAHTCALLETKQVRCWGSGKQGQLGHGTSDDIGDHESPASAGDVPLDEYATAVSADGDVTCAVIGPAPESIRCWGDNRNGMLGYGGEHHGNLGDDESIKTVMPIRFPGKVQQLAYPCALFDDGSVTCWSTAPGDSRDAAVAATERPKKNLGAPVARLELFGSGCVVTRAGRARCWTGGSLGYEGEDVVVRGNKHDRDLLELPFLSVASVAVAGDHGCVLLPGGEVRCWGERRLGMLGTPSGDGVISKDAVAVDIGRPAVALAVGNARSCVITDQGGVRCWGYGKDGLLGYGTTENVGETRPPSALGDVPLIP